jgi:hypothetical protein
MRGPTDRVILVPLGSAPGRNTWGNHLRFGQSDLYHGLGYGA